MEAEIILVLNCLRSGGAEKQLLWIASELVSVGKACTILELAAGERTERIESMVRAAVDKGVVVLRAPTGSGNFLGYWRLKRLLRSSRPFVIWSWGLRADSICHLVRIGEAARRIRWIVSIRSAVPRPGNFRSMLWNFLVRRCDGVVSNTHLGLVLSKVRGIVGLPQWILPNAVIASSTGTIALPAIRPERLVLVMLGNIKVHTKGYDLAIRTARKLRDKGVRFELRIAGRPDEIEELDALIIEHTVGEVVKFYGEVSYPEEFLCEGHLYLLLSRFEGMPNTLLEALNVGLPAIATEVGDLRALKDSGAPYGLIPIDNVDAVVTAVEEAVANWENTRAVAAGGRQWVQENFSEAACRAKLQCILTEVLAP